MTDPLDPGTDVGLYVHWPYCARICPYCDFNVVRDRGRGDEQAGLVEAIAAGGSSLRDHRQASGELGYFQHSFRVYDREGQPCARPGCAGTVRRIVQSGRSTWYCPTCQH